MPRDARRRRYGRSGSISVNAPLMTSPGDFAKVTAGPEKPPLQPAATVGNGMLMAEGAKPAFDISVGGYRNLQGPAVLGIPQTPEYVGRAGIEHPANSPEKPQVSNEGGAESGAPIAESPALPPDLRELANAWPMLPSALKAGILAMVKAANAGRSA